MMEFQSTFIKDLFVVHTNVQKDSRGYFYRAYCKEDSSRYLLDTSFVQTNISHNYLRGTIRGLHMQVPPCAEVKFIRCVRGKIFDVAVDLRKNSTSFLTYFAIELSEENGLGLWIPEGFAHGFQVLEDQSTLLYQHSASYNNDCEFSISYLEPRIGIIWPESLTEISDKDREVSFLKETFEGIEI